MGKLIVLWLCFLSIQALSEKEREEALENVMNLHKHWYVEAVNGLFDSLKMKNLPKLWPRDRSRLEYCSQKAKKDIIAKAKCLSTAFESRNKFNFASQAKRYFAVSRQKYFTLPRKTVTQRPKNLRWVGDFAVSRQKPLQKKTKKLRGRDRLAYLNGLASKMNAKSKLVRFSRRRSKRFIRNLNRMPKHMKTENNVFLNVFSSLMGQGKRKAEQLDGKISKLQNYMRLNRLATKKQKQFGRKEKGIFEQLLHMLLNRQNSDKNFMRVLSPKFFSIFPNPENDRHFLSPDILALHNQSSLLSLDSLLNGIRPEERKAIVSLIMQVSGADKSVDKLLKYFEDPTPQWERHKIIQANVRITDAWERVDRSYSVAQRSELQTQGFTFVTREQLDILYGPQGLYNDTNVDHNIDLDAYNAMDNQEREAYLEELIRSMAHNHTNPAMRGWSRRLKQSILSPGAFGPSILSPGLLGPAVLSPSIFSPSILSPGALNPGILSPGVGNPSILSPHVLSPGVLSPGVLSPSVLSPNALSPGILSPGVLGPSILSPSALSPSILSPGVLGISVLSPGVLNPSVLSPSVLGGDVLSPKALSPSFLSPGVLGADVLSPSILS